MDTKNQVRNNKIAQAIASSLGGARGRATLLFACKAYKDITNALGHRYSIGACANQMKKFISS